MEPYRSRWGLGRPRCHACNPATAAGSRPRSRRCGCGLFPPSDRPVRRTQRLTLALSMVLPVVALAAVMTASSNNVVAIPRITSSSNAFRLLQSWYGAFLIWPTVGLCCLPLLAVSPSIGKKEDTATRRIVVYGALLILFGVLAVQSQPAGGVQPHSRRLPRPCPVRSGACTRNQAGHLPPSPPGPAAFAGGIRGVGGGREHRSPSCFVDAARCGDPGRVRSQPSARPGHLEHQRPLLPAGRCPTCHPACGPDR